MTSKEPRQTFTVYRDFGKGKVLHASGIAAPAFYFGENSTVFDLRVMSSRTSFLGISVSDIPYLDVRQVRSIFTTRKIPDRDLEERNDPASTTLFVVAGSHTEYYIFEALHKLSMLSRREWSEFRKIWEIDKNQLRLDIERRDRFQAFKELLNSAPNMKTLHEFQSLLTKEKVRRRTIGEQ